MATNSPDRLSLGIKLMLALLGAFLLVLGWYRFLA
jgi:hypothetical protein